MTKAVRRVLVTGSRGWTDRHTLFAALRELQAEKPRTTFVVVHGDCPTGADAMAKDWVLGMQAGKNDVLEESYPADWKLLGKAAGPIRNQMMVDLGGYEVVLAFPLGKSAGTRGCMAMAERAGFTVRVFEPQEEAA